MHIGCQPFATTLDYLTIIPDASLSASSLLNSSPTRASENSSAVPEGKIEMEHSNNDEKETDSERQSNNHQSQL
jgi:hypothetical protein